MSWSSISFSELFNISYADALILTIYLLVSFSSLLVGVSETYGLSSALLLFMITQKTLSTVIFAPNSVKNSISISNLYNTKSYLALTLLTARNNS